jgi:hypothetical protein
MEQKQLDHIIMERLGSLVTSLEDLKKNISENRQSAEKYGNRTTLALIGIIAAQIGVKVLGTPILLDVATIIGIIGIVILLGAITQGLRLIRRKCTITLTGWAMVAMMSCVAIVQVMVYFRDLGILSADVIYIMRIIQNLAILGFAWRFMIDHNITADKPDKPGECKG